MEGFMKRFYIIAVIVLSIAASAFTAVMAATTGDVVDNRPGSVTNVTARYNHDTIFVSWNFPGQKDGVTVYFYGRDRYGKKAVYNWVVSTQNNYLKVGRNPDIMKIDYVTVVAFSIDDGSTINESWPSRPVKPSWTWKKFQY